MNACAELHEYTAALLAFLRFPSAVEIWEFGRRIYSLPLHNKAECNLRHTTINILHNKWICLAAEDRTVILFFKCIFVLRAV